MADAPAAVEQKTLESLGVSKDIAENAKLMWIVSGIFSIWGPILFGYVIKKEGQDQSEWYKAQVKACWIIAIISFIGYYCFFGWLFGIYLGWLGFSQIGAGKDPHVMIVAKDGFKPAGA
ncbi:hypothetical protein EDM80_02545 [bacterium]|nr:MAG: hypothetical protein EDM80_02545 [bacterium]MBV6515201.1 hypothetical protein [Planctomycetota bacterium]RIK62467.1 MAG: hypothetical protein DCC64_10320 [Planctomycetota bacterium]HRJ79466.1 hypothetical protein [Planctomycetota bacterium]